MTISKRTDKIIMVTIVVFIIIWLVGTFIFGWEEWPSQRDTDDYGWQSPGN